jgi:hypothetical protein
MSSSSGEATTARALEVFVTDDTLTVDLVDGRTLSVPIAWYPRLVHATAAERANCRMTGQGRGIHWPDLDEDVSVDGLLAGRASQESQASLQKWLQSRRATG